MSNMPDINSKRITVTLSLPVFAQLRKFAQKHNLTINDAARLVFARELESVQLDPNDYIWIAEQVEVNTQKRNEVKNG